MNAAAVRPSFLAWVLSLSVFALIVACLAPASLASASGSPPTVDAVNHAGLVIAFGDGTVRSVCVAFPEEEISGVELLSRSALQPVMSPDGAVCAIGGEGCPADDCFCQCASLQDCSYWGNYHLENDQWVYAEFGPALTVIRDGDVEGWAWGKGDFAGMSPPPVLTFDEICAAQPPTPTPSPIPLVALPEPGTLPLTLAGLGMLAAYFGARARRR